MKNKKKKKNLAKKRQRRRELNRQKTIRKRRNRIEQRKQSLANVSSSFEFSPFTGTRDSNYPFQSPKNFIRGLFGDYPEYNQSSDYIFGYQNSFYWTNEQYLAEMNKYADLENTWAPEVSFPGRSVIYSVMTEEQLNFYLYWRTLARRGNLKKTDYNYYHLYWVELLNLVGCSSIEDAFDKLNKFYPIFFSQDNPFELTSTGISNLNQELFDFSFFHNLDLTQLNPQIWSNLDSYERYLLALDSFDQSGKLTLPFALIQGIAQFDLAKKSKTYSLQKNKFEEAIINVFFVIDSLKRKEKNESLIDSTGRYKRKKKLFIYPFEHVVVDNGTYSATKKARSNINYNSVQNYFSAIIQEVENTFRSFNGERGRLRKFKLDDWTKEIIENFLTSKYNSNSSYRYTGTLKSALEYLIQLEDSKKIELDLKKIEQLRSDTEIVQDLLDSSKYEETQSPVSNQENSLNYVEPLTFVLSSLIKFNPEYIKFLTDLLNSNDYIDSHLSMEEIDTIHQITQRYLNQPLLDINKNKITINKIYESSLNYIFDNRQNYPFLNIQRPSSNSANEEIMSFIKNLKPSELKFLKILINESNPEYSLHELAESEMTMVEIMFDDINNSALLFLDDIALEMGENNTPYILEEYFDTIKTLVEMEI